MEAYQDRDYLMDMLDRVEVQVASGPLDESEVDRLREIALVRDSDVYRLEQRIRAMESKTNRIWYILTVIGFLAWAWIDGRFGLTTPNAVPVHGATVASEAVELNGEVLTTEGPGTRNPF